MHSLSATIWSILEKKFPQMSKLFWTRNKFYLNFYRPQIVGIVVINDVSQGELLNRAQETH